MPSTEKKTSSFIENGTPNLRSDAQNEENIQKTMVQSKLPLSENKGQIWLFGNNNTCVKFENNCTKF